MFMSMSGASGFRHNLRQKTARLQGGPRCCNIHPPFSTESHQGYAGLRKSCLERTPTERRSREAGDTFYLCTYYVTVVFGVPLK